MGNVISDFSDLLLKSPKNCWLALSEDETRVIATGETPEEAQANASAAGVEDPLLLWSPDEWIPHVFQSEKN
jgi:hypothetical protein